MCIPVDTALGAAGNIFAAREQARVGARQAEAFTKQGTLDMQAVAARTRETRQAYRDQIGARALDTQRSLGRLSAALGDTGLVGGSNERLRADVLRVGGNDIAIMQESAFRSSEQGRRELDAIAQRTQNQIANIQRPSYIQAGLSTMSSALTSRAPSMFDLWALTGAGGSGGIKPVAPLDAGITSPMIG